MNQVLVVLEKPLLLIFLGISWYTKIGRSLTRIHWQNLPCNAFNPNVMYFSVHGRHLLGPKYLYSMTSALWPQIVTVTALTPPCDLYYVTVIFMSLRHVLWSEWRHCDVFNVSVNCMTSKWLRMWRHCELCDAGYRRLCPALSVDSFMPVISRRASCLIGTPRTAHTTLKVRVSKDFLFSLMFFIPQLFIVPCLRF